MKHGAVNALESLTTGVHGPRPAAAERASPFFILSVAPTASVARGFPRFSIHCDATRAQNKSLRGTLSREPRSVTSSSHQQPHAGGTRLEISAFGEQESRRDTRRDTRKDTPAIMAPSFVSLTIEYALC